jgi:hypothetical protein
LIFENNNINLGQAERKAARAKKRKQKEKIEAEVAIDPKGKIYRNFVIVDWLCENCTRKFK